MSHPSEVGDGWIEGEMGIDGMRGRWREEFNEDGEERIDRGRKDDERMRVSIQIVKMCY